MALRSGTKLGPYETTSEQMFYGVSKDAQRFLINTQIPQA
jgi:hypothetical protein